MEALDFIAGPGGWLSAHWWDGQHGGIAFVRFVRSDDERWHAAQLFTAEPTRTSLRRLPLHRIEVAANAGGPISERLAARLDDPAPPIGSLEFHKEFTGYSTPDQPPLELKRPSGHRLDDEFYRRVAETYVAANDRGLKPRTTIAEVAGVSTDVAGRWVREARKRGYLPPTRPGRVFA